MARKTRKPEFAFGLSQGFAKALKEGVNRSITSRNLGMGEKSRDWLFRAPPKK